MLMGRKKQQLPEEVGRLRESIEDWRKTKVGRGRMPEEMWAQAVALGVEHGAYRVARSLRIGYDSLRKRMARNETGSAACGERRRNAKPNREMQGYVEFPADLLAMGERVGAGSNGRPHAVTVELSASDGSRLTVRLPEVGNADLLGLAQSFWGRLA
jgi:hypothetical protein